MQLGEWIAAGKQVPDTLAPVIVAYGHEYFLDISMGIYSKSDGWKVLSVEVTGGKAVSELMSNENVMYWFQPYAAYCRPTS